MRIQLIIILFLITKLVQAQRIPAYDSISTSQQDYPCVVQALDDGTLLMAAVSRPWLWNGKGSLVLVHMDIEGQPMYHKTLELPDMGFNNAGGIFKTGENQYTIFCTFDTTTPTFNNKPTHFGYIQTDTLFEFIDIHYMAPNYYSPIARSGIYDIKIKHRKNTEYFGTLGIADTSLGSPYIIDAYFNLQTHSISYQWDTLNFLKTEDNRIIQLRMQQVLPMDFLWAYEDYLIKYRKAAFSSNSAPLNIYNCRDTLWTGLYLGGVLPFIGNSMFDPKHWLDFEWRSNIKHFKDSLLLLAGTGRYNCEVGYCLDTLYQYKPGQSGIAIIPLNQHALRNFSNIPYRFTFVEDIREAFYDTNDDGINMYRLYGDLYSSAFMHCLDYWDENKIYYGRQLGDVVNVQRSYNSFPSLLLISQFDSTLHKVWERRIPARNREGIVSVNATLDGGVILTTRSSTGPFDDPQFPGIQMHKFDIAVYKFNQHGVITSLNKLIESENQNKFSLYPNPANQYVHIKGNAPIATLQVWDTQGKQYSVKFNAENQIIVIDTLPVGIYFVQLYNSNNELLNVLRLVKN
jgi:hypothetical protein